MNIKIKFLAAARLLTIVGVCVLIFANGAIGQSDITLNLDDAEIRQLLSDFAEGGGISIILSDSVKGNVSVNLDKVPAKEAISLILTANGFVMEEVGNVILAGTPEEIRGYVPEYIKVIPLSYISATELAASLSGIAGAEVQVQAVQRTNSIIVRGSEADVQKMEDIARILDVEIPEEPKEPVITTIFPLEYAEASSLQKVLSDLVSPEGKVTVEDKTNSVIITDSDSVVKRLADLIEKLDIETPSMVAARLKEEAEAQRKIKEAQAPPPPGVVTQVFNLNHVDGNAIKAIIEGLLSSRGSIQTFVRQEKTLPPIRISQSGGFGEQLGGESQQRQAAGEVGKWSDSLVITDEESVLNEIAALIEKLDTMADQVKIEAKVVELNADDAVELGIDWQGTHSPSGSTGEGNFPFSTPYGVDFNLGTFTEGKFEELLVRIRALEELGKANIMFEPSVMTLDNERAQMVVAERIPVTRTYETEFRSTTGFEFIDVGVSLSVIPHITEDGHIIMDAMPQVDSVKGWTAGEDSQPIISSRVANTRVRVKDGQTFAIGGLMREEETEEKSGIPILCRIPLLGRLFSSTRNVKTKTDLVVFITPKIQKEE